MIKNNEILFNNYLPTAFWTMEPTAWQEYVGELKGKARQVLSYYPFKWVSAPPGDSQEAVDFLRDIGVDDGRVSVDLVEEQLASLPSFESLVNQGSVERVLLCQCGPGFEKYDEQAIEVYHQALPDYEIIPIDCSLLSNGGGGINCATHEIPDVGRLVDW